ncbi:MAG: coproporphyrinogen dehydrogenase HemZ, partial [Lachnospiraceae bacterium]|nr:coproporphyrinogen dehydrogenase HemZ [Lachnospiraceae bacterium]
MIKVDTNKAQFEYDIHSLVKAFYPEQTVKVITPDTVIRRNTSVTGDVEGETEEKIQLSFQEDAVSLVLGDKEFTWDGQTEGKYKDAFKAFLYTSLCEHTGKKLPWGNLTGIRPTKIAMGMLEEGKEESEIRTFLQNTHFVSDEKVDLSIEIAKREKQLLSQIHYADGYSLYIGIPFCPTTCLYCSFTSYPICAWESRVGDYLTALEKEIDYVKEAYADKILDSIYIGGGTPTTLTAEQLDRLLSKVRESFDFTEVKEFTVEAGRADSITRDKLRVMKKHGITRISVNPQTMKEETLKLIGRRHTVEQVKEAFVMAREEGFTNINMDLILGLPEETKADVNHTLEEVKKLHPDSITVHSLAIKRASKMSQWIIENGISTLHNTDETMKLAAKAAADMDMLPYYLYRQKNMSGNFENVGYAKEGNFGIYNILIMEEVQTIVALGAGSITKRVFPDGRIERCDNVKDVALYIEKIDEMIER